MKHGLDKAGWKLFIKKKTEDVEALHTVRCPLTGIQGTGLMMTICSSSGLASLGSKQKRKSADA